MSNEDTTEQAAAPREPFAQERLLPEFIASNLTWLHGTVAMLTERECVVQHVAERHNRQLFNEHYTAESYVVTVLGAKTQIYIEPARVALRDEAYLSKRLAAVLESEAKP